MPGQPAPQAATDLQHRSGGFTLVELLVSVAISMVVIMAAATVYLGTREAQRSLFEKAYAFESAKFALDLIGREIENAGFYPAIRSATVATSPNSVTAQAYVNPIETSPPTAYNSAVFGCQAGQFLPASTLCATHSSTTDADTLVLNYYTNDATGLDAGNRADCQHQDVADDPINSTRRNAAHATPATANNAYLRPLSPLFISNSYTLTATPMQVEGQTITTFSLACHGNGISPTDNSYQPLISGIDQLRFYFLTSSTSGSQFKRAGAAGADWPNVVAVRVCLLARSLQSARLRGGFPYTLSDCDGVSRTFTDGLERRVFSQVFALKNQLHETF
jgi:type IV pilus assembly protein PilW